MVHATQSFVDEVEMRWRAAAANAGPIDYVFDQT